MEKINPMHMKPGKIYMRKSLYGDVVFRAERTPEHLGLHKKYYSIYVKVYHSTQMHIKCNLKKSSYMTINFYPESDFYQLDESSQILYATLQE